jgi:hypothetical protein
MNIRAKVEKRGKRHHIRIDATPMTAATRALLQRLRREVAAFTRKWKAHVTKQAKAAKRPARRRRRK